MFLFLRNTLIAMLLPLPMVRSNDVVIVGIGRQARRYHAPNPISRRTPSFVSFMCPRERPISIDLNAPGV